MTPDYVGGNGGRGTHVDIGDPSCGSIFGNNTDLFTGTISFSPVNTSNASTSTDEANKLDENNTDTAQQVGVHSKAGQLNTSVPGTTQHRLSAQPLDSPSSLFPDLGLEAELLDGSSLPLSHFESNGTKEWNGNNQAAQHTLEVAGGRSCSAEDLGGSNLGQATGLEPDFSSLVRGGMSELDVVLGLNVDGMPGGLDLPPLMLRNMSDFNLAGLGQDNDIQDQEGATATGTHASSSVGILSSSGHGPDNEVDFMFELGPDASTREDQNTQVTGVMQGIARGTTPAASVPHTYPLSSSAALQTVDGASNRRHSRHTAGMVRTYGSDGDTHQSDVVPSHIVGQRKRRQSSACTSVVIKTETNRNKPPLRFVQVAVKRARRSCPLLSSRNKHSNSALSNHEREGSFTDLNNAQQQNSQPNTSIFGDNLPVGWADAQAAAAGSLLPDPVLSPAPQGSGAIHLNKHKLLRLQLPSGMSSVNWGVKTPPKIGFSSPTATGSVTALLPSLTTSSVPTYSLLDSPARRPSPTPPNPSPTHSWFHDLPHTKPSTARPTGAQRSYELGRNFKIEHPAPSASSSAHDLKQPSSLSPSIEVGSTFRRTRRLRVQVPTTQVDLPSKTHKLRSTRPGSTSPRECSLGARRFKCRRLSDDAIVEDFSMAEAMPHQPASGRERRNMRTRSAAAAENKGHGNANVRGRTVMASPGPIPSGIFHVGPVRSTGSAEKVAPTAVSEPRVNDVLSERNLRGTMKMGMSCVGGDDERRCGEEVGVGGERMVRCGEEGSEDSAGLVRCRGDDGGDSKRPVKCEGEVSEDTRLLATCAGQVEEDSERLVRCRGQVDGDNEQLARGGGEDGGEVVPGNECKRGLKYTEDIVKGECGKSEIPFSVGANEVEELVQLLGDAGRSMSREEQSASRLEADLGGDGGNAGEGEGVLVPSGTKTVAQDKFLVSKVRYILYYLRFNDITPGLVHSSGLVDAVVPFKDHPHPLLAASAMQLLSKLVLDNAHRTQLGLLPFATAKMPPGTKKGRCTPTTPQLPPLPTRHGRSTLF